MRGILFVTALVAMPAAAQEVPAVDACKRVAAYLHTLDEIPVSGVQDLSELDPPRVRMRAGDLMPQALSCTFTSRQPPLGLVEYCFSGECFSDGPRFEEIVHLLSRDGY